MTEQISDEELEDIVSLIRIRHGYDFSNYAAASLKRRVEKFMQQSKASLFDLKYHITNDKAYFFWMLQSLTVNVTEMFRDPQFYKMMRETILPKLSSYPIIKIWHAGCSTGEEVFSMAILLKELDLLKRSKIYATDINISNVEKAVAGIIPMHYMKDYTANYIKSGGTEDFSDYYTAKYNNAIIKKELKKNIVFSQHNLVTDHAFNEFHLICCRNVLIYFNNKLQNHAMTLFYESLAPLGYLALGTKESIAFTDVQTRFETVSGTNKIFRRKE
jgi:chemotaxis protein methyltransferase CheR